MSYLMIGYDPALLCTEDPVFLLFTYQNYFNSFEKIFLGYCAASTLNSKDSSLVDHISQIRTHCPGSCKCNVLKINSLIQMYISCMNLQDLDSSLQIRSVHNDTSVKTSRTKKCRIKNLRTVGSSQDQKSL